MEKLKKAVAVGMIVAAGCLIWFLNLKPEEKNSDKVIALNQPRAMTKSLIAGEPAMPKGFKTNTNWRDPFALPDKLLLSPRSNDETPPGIEMPEAPLNSLNNIDSSNSGGNLPVLVGIISSGSRRAAIIKVNEGSRTYKIKDRLDGQENYELIHIGEKTVILESLEGNRELTLKR